MHSHKSNIKNIWNTTVLKWNPLWPFCFFCCILKTNMSDTIWEGLPMFLEYRLISNLFYFFRLVGHYHGKANDPKRWKANFRCALNSLKDVEEVTNQSISKGMNAFRVYRIMESLDKPSRTRRGHSFVDIYSKYGIYRFFV